MEGGVVTDEVLRQELNKPGRSQDDHDLLKAQHEYIVYLLSVTKWVDDNMKYQMMLHKNRIDAIIERINAK